MHTTGSLVARRRRQIDSCLAIKVFHVGVYLDAIIICAVIGPAAVKQTRTMIFIRTYRVSVDSITKCTRKRKIVGPVAAAARFIFALPGEIKPRQRWLTATLKANRSTTEHNQSAPLLFFSRFSTEQFLPRAVAT